MTTAYRNGFEKLISPEDAGRLPAYFDWYAASLEPGNAGEHVFRQLHDALGGDAVERTGRHGYGVRRELRHGDRVVVGVSSDGSQGRVLVEASGGDAVKVSEVVRDLWPAHRVTRADSAMDWDGEGAWETLLGATLTVARGEGVSTSVTGDWLSEAAAKGRTLYVGGRTSSTRMRLYEKGKQLPELGRPHLVRAELEVRPQKAGKAVAARLSPAELWGVSKWSHRLGNELMRVQVERVSLAGYVPPDFERARRALVTQYGHHLQAWAAEYGDDWSVLGRVLRQEVLSRLA